jgi:hypothetical protein
MPVILSSEVSFQGLQAALTQAQESLKKVYQITSALEARASKSERAIQAPSADQPATGSPPPANGSPVDLGMTDADMANAPRNPDGSVKVDESFEKSIAEMRRIAGLR